MEKFVKFLCNNSFDFEWCDPRFSRVDLTVNGETCRATMLFLYWEEEYSPDIYFTDSGEVYVLVETGVRTPTKGLKVTGDNLFFIQTIRSDLEDTFGEDEDEVDLEDRLDEIAQMYGWVVVDLSAKHVKDDDFMVIE